jgi:uncharacterized protein
MNYFALKLIPPRTTFDRDMTEAERAIMRRHVGYWSDLLKRRIAIVFGPVTDPSGSWGLAVVEGQTVEDVRALCVNDPAVTSGLATVDVFPMPNAIVRA